MQELFRSEIMISPVAGGTQPLEVIPIIVAAVLVLMVKFDYLRYFIVTTLAALGRMVFGVCHSNIRFSWYRFSIAWPRAILGSSFIVSRNCKLFPANSAIYWVSFCPGNKSSVARSRAKIFPNQLTFPSLEHLSALSAFDLESFPNPSRHESIFMHRPRRAGLRAKSTLFTVPSPKFFPAQLAGIERAASMVRFFERGASC